MRRMRIFIRQPSLIKSSNRWQRDGIGTATSVDPRGAMPRPIPLVDRKQIVHTPIIYTAIVFRQAMPRLMSPCVPMRALHKGARG